VNQEELYVLKTRKGLVSFSCEFLSMSTEESYELKRLLSSLLLIHFALFNIQIAKFFIDPFII